MNNTGIKISKVQMGVMQSATTIASRAVWASDAVMNALINKGLVEVYTGYDVELRRPYQYRLTDLGHSLVRF